MSQRLLPSSSASTFRLKKRGDRFHALLQAWWFGALLVMAGTYPESDLEAGQIVVESCRVVLIHEAVLACDRAGIIATVDFREGDRVKTNQRLVQLRADTPRMALEIARKESSNQAKIRFSEKAAELAETEHKMGLRANELQPGALAELELLKQRLAIDKAEAELALAKFEMELAELRTKQAEAELKAFIVEAPFDGTITRIHRRPGEVVRQGDPVVEMVATDVLRIEGYLPVRSAWSATVGDEAQVWVEIPGEDLPIESETFSGRVVFVDLKSQPVDGGVRVYVEVQNVKNLLRAGLTARMTITPQHDLIGSDGASLRVAPR